MNKLILGSIAAIALTNAAHAQLSAYTPQRGQLISSFAYEYQRYDRFWVGKTKIPLELATGFKAQRQHSAFLSLEYGICDDLALDVTIGYSWAEFHRGPVRDLTDDGLTDTSFGLRYRVVDERKVAWAPTVTLRVGGVIAGTYNESLVFSAGDGADAIETSMLLAKQLCPGLGLYGEAGYRWRNNDVPDDFFGAAGIALTYIKDVTLSVGYRETRGLSGPDIGAPGFGTAFGFPQVREIDQRLETSLSYTDHGGRNYAVYFAQTLNGRNTGEKSIIGVSVSIPFGGHEAAVAPSYKK